MCKTSLFISPALAGATRSGPPGSGSAARPPPFSASGSPPVSASGAPGQQGQTYD